MRIGIADTTFARYDMGALAEETIADNSEHSVRRYTVPGIKDLPVAAKRLIDESRCDIVVALGMPGPKPIDKQCAHEASAGIIQVQLMTNIHVLEVFVHEDEAEDDGELVSIVKDRTVKHALNAIALLKGGRGLRAKAGSGARQGKPDVMQL
ncbi:MAG: riboflavin synthase [archaeon]